MRIEHWTAIFVILFIAMFIPFYFGMKRVSTGVSDNSKAESSLYASCQDAIAETDPGTDRVFGNHTKRLAAMNSFYDTLSANYNFGYMAGTDRTQDSTSYVASSEDARYHVPCVAMVDWDGFYINYTKNIKGDNGQSDQNRNITTEKYAFGQDFATKDGKVIKTDSTTSGNIIRIAYRLDDEVTIDVLKNGEKRNHYEGDMIKAYTLFAEDWDGSKDLLDEWFGSYEGRSINYQSDLDEAIDEEKEVLKLEQDLNDYEKAGKEVQAKVTLDEITKKEADIKAGTKNLRKYYTEFKNRYIASIIEPQIEYFINLHNDLYNTKQAGYMFTMPNMREKDLHKMLDAPCVVAFFQGKQADDVKNEGQYINVYSICGAELTEMEYYTIAPEIQNGKLVYVQADKKTTKDVDESRNTYLEDYSSDPDDPLVTSLIYNGQTYYLKLTYHLAGHEIKDDQTGTGSTDTFTVGCEDYDGWIQFCKQHKKPEQTWEEFSADFFKRLGINEQGTAKECAKNGANPCSMCIDLDNP